MRGDSDQDDDKEDTERTHGGRHRGGTAADGGCPTGVHRRPVGRGRGVMPGGRGVRVARARRDGAPRVRSGGRRGGHAAAAGRVPPEHGGARAAAQEQAGRHVRTVLVPSRYVHLYFHRHNRRNN